MNNLEAKATLETAVTALQTASRVIDRYEEASREGKDLIFEFDDTTVLVKPDGDVVVRQPRRYYTRKTLDEQGFNRVLLSGPGAPCSCCGGSGKAG